MLISSNILSEKILKAGLNKSDNKISNIKYEDYNNFSDDHENNIIFEKCEKIENNLENFNFKNIISENAKEFTLQDFSFDTVEHLILGNEELIEKTLPGLIISLIIKNSYQIKEEFLMNYISPIIGNLRKPDGSKYKAIKIFYIK